MIAKNVRCIYEHEHANPYNVYTSTFGFSACRTQTRLLVPLFSFLISKKLSAWLLLSLQLLCFPVYQHNILKGMYPLTSVCLVVMPVDFQILTWFFGYNCVVEFVEKTLHYLLCIANLHHHKTLLPLSSLSAETNFWIIAVHQSLHQGCFAHLTTRSIFRLEWRERDSVDKCALRKINIAVTLLTFFFKRLSTRRNPFPVECITRQKLHDNAKTQLIFLTAKSLFCFKHT